MSKTALANLIDQNKTNRNQNQTDMDHLKVAFTLLMAIYQKTVPIFWNLKSIESLIGRASVVSRIVLT